MTPLTELPETVYLEPPRGNPKARVACSLPGCQARIVETRLLCDVHDYLIPNHLRMENRQLYRAAKAATNNDEYLMLDAALVQIRLACINAVIAKVAP